MDRRQVLAAGGAWLALTGRASAQASDLRAAAREAWLYCVRWVGMAGGRGGGGSPGGGGPPRVKVSPHAGQLAGPASRAVTAPNNDSLYSPAWIDLSEGPITLVLPSAGARYFSLALMDMFTNNFTVLGTRTIGGQGGEFTLVGPSASAPHDAIRAPTPWVWALGRTLVDGAGDLEAAHQVQDGLMIRGKAGSAPPRGPGRGAAWNDYFLWAQQLLDENPPPATDLALFRRIAPLQLGPASGFEKARFADVEVGEIQDGVNDARAAIHDFGALQQSVGRGNYPQADLGNFGQDYLYRAAVALGGLAALPCVEAMYMQPVAPDGSARLRDDHYCR